MLTSNNLGIRKVKDPKIKPPERVTMLKQNKTVCHPSVNTEGSLFFFILSVSNSVSSNSIKANNWDKPKKRQMIEGTINANLQSAKAIKTPVKTGANATPILPQTPFIKKEKPNLTPVKKNDICAVQIDNSEISLKKVELMKENIKIYGDNDKFNPLTIKKERVKIIAKMIGLVRNY